MKDKISIIGFGNFGKFIANHLKEKAEIVITDIFDKTKDAEKIGIKFISLDNALKNKIIILAVPMEKFTETLHKIKNKLIPETLILDVCSLKIFACNAMKEILPKTIEIVGTHPLFGPQSAPDDIKGMKIALCNVRVKNKNFSKVKDFLEDLGLKVIVTTPEEHDKQIAVSQSLTHFICQIANNLNLKRVELSTKTFDDLMNIIDIIKNNPKSLFNDMQTMNPFAQDVRNKFIDAGINLNFQLNKLQEERMIF
ncbi:MAG: prephenate dehydrogenase/arogenate dehydrogenase family protein [Nanoarchaeota archaeon]